MVFGQRNLDTYPDIERNDVALHAGDSGSESTDAHPPHETTLTWSNGPAPAIHDGRHDDEGD